jgi:hypothetical protein
LQQLNTDASTSSAACVGAKGAGGLQASVTGQRQPTPSATGADNPRVCAILLARGLRAYKLESAAGSTAAPLVLHNISKAASEAVDLGLSARLTLAVLAARPQHFGTSS